MCHALRVKFEKKAARRASQPLGVAGAIADVGAATIAGTTDKIAGRSKASASVSVSRRIGREKSTRPLRWTDQTGMVPVG